MATGTLDLLVLNKNRAKRDMTSGVFTLQVELPNGNVLPDGAHTLGEIEGNIVITHVSLLTRIPFDGTAPVVTIADNNGRTYFTDASIATANVVESDLTANSATIPDPIYVPEGTNSVFTGTVTVGGSTVGECSLVVTYVQLDTVTGKHTR